MTDEELLKALGGRARAVEAEQPISPAALESMVAEVERRFGDELRGGASATDAQPKQGRSWSVALGLVLPFAAAFALLVWRFDDAPQPGVMPHYRIEVERVAREQRAAEPAPEKVLRIQRDRAPRFLLRPDSPTSARANVAVIVRPAAAADMSQRWPHQVERDPSGALRVTLDRVEALPARGALSVEVAMGSADPTRFDFEFSIASK